MNRPHATRVRGLYAVTPDTADTELLVRMVAAAIDGGAGVVQYRNKRASAGTKLAQAKALNALCVHRGVPLIVNDDVQIAREVDAAGAHVGAEDATLDAARAALGADRIIGVSCYDRFELAAQAARDGADYIAFGSFYPSSVKPAAVRASLDLLTRAKAELPVPVVAIGGITVENAPALVDAGADAVAVISALFSAADIAAEARRFCPLFRIDR